MRTKQSFVRKHSLLNICQRLVPSAALWLATASIAQAEMASVYGNGDGHCGRPTASGEHLNCGAMTAAHRSLPLGSVVRVCHNGCVTVRINDRGPFVRGRQIDLSPAAARAIKLHDTGYVTVSAVSRHKP